MWGSEHHFALQQTAASRLSQWHAASLQSAHTRRKWGLSSLLWRRPHFDERHYCCASIYSDELQLPRPGFIYLPVRETIMQIWLAKHHKVTIYKYSEKHWGNVFSFCIVFFTCMLQEQLCHTPTLLVLTIRTFWDLFQTTVQSNLVQHKHGLHSILIIIHTQPGKEINGPQETIVTDESNVLIKICQGEQNHANGIISRCFWREEWIGRSPILQ